MSINQIDNTWLSSEDNIQVNIDVVDVKKTSRNGTIIATIFIVLAVDIVIYGLVGSGTNFLYNNYWAFFGVFLGLGIISGLGSGLFYILYGL